MFAFHTTTVDNFLSICRDELIRPLGKNNRKRYGNYGASLCINWLAKEYRYAFFSYKTPIISFNSKDSVNKDAAVVGFYFDPKYLIYQCNALVGTMDLYEIYYLFLDESIEVISGEYHSFNKEMIRQALLNQDMSVPGVEIETQKFLRKVEEIQKKRVRGKAALEMLMSESYTDLEILVENPIRIKDRLGFVFEKKRCVRGVSNLVMRLVDCSISEAYEIVKEL